VLPTANECGNWQPGLCSRHCRALDSDLVTWTSQARRIYSSIACTTARLALPGASLARLNGDCYVWLLLFCQQGSLAEQVSR
jgi:hypothetical protein